MSNYLEKLHTIIALDEVLNICYNSLSKSFF